MIHMTETRYNETTRKWYVFCNCGWTSIARFFTQNAARNAGDEHLKEANN